MARLEEFFLDEDLSVLGVEMRRGGPAHCLSGEAGICNSGFSGLGSEV